MSLTKIYHKKEKIIIQYTLQIIRIIDYKYIICTQYILTWLEIIDYLLKQLMHLHIFLINNLEFIKKINL